MVKRKTKIKNLDEYALFKQMADCAPCLLWMSRNDSLCIFFNKTWLDFTGRTVEQEWGVGWTEGVHFEDFQRCVDTYMLHFNNRTSFEMEYRLRRHDGEYRWILDRGVPYFDIEGNFSGFIGSCIDVTEIKNASQLLKGMNIRLEEKIEERTSQLKQSQLELEEAETIAQLGRWNWNLKNSHFVWSDVLYKMTGLSHKTKLTYEKILSLCHPDDRDLFDSTIKRSILEKRPYEFVYRILFKKKNIRYLWARINVDLNKKNEPIKLIGTALDITDLTLAKMKAEEAFRLQSEFVSMVSHELRTPMTAIKSSIEIITRGIKGNIPNSMRPLLDVVQRNSDRMLRLINNILDIEKIEAGKLIFKKKPQFILPLIEQAIISNGPYAEKFEVKLKLKHIIPDAVAKIDADRFIQVLDNLLSNAAKFSRPKTTVIISMKRSTPNLLISVKDCGKGIPAEFSDKIFSKFMQADEHTPQAHLGSGLGLSIAKSIMEEHEGSIYYKTSSKGTTFIISLPEFETNQSSV